MRRLPAFPLFSALFLIVCVALSGCTGGTGADAGASSPKAGGTVTYGIDTAPACFDIHASSADMVAEIQRNVFDSLVSEDTGHTFHPWLAESWTVAGDLKSYTFRLRHDVTFSDGTPFDADAVKANFDHIVAPATKSQYAKNLLGPYRGTEVLDPYTVRIDFTQPFAPFLQAASTAYLGFYSPKALAANADKLCAGGPADVGSGPFLFSSYTKGQSIVLTRNPGYRWGPANAAHTGPAYLDSLVFRVLPEDSTRVGALTSGQIDGAKSVPPLQVKTVEADSGVALLRMDQPGEPYGLYLNTSAAPLDDQRVRQAVQAGINVTQDVQAVYFGQYKQSWGPLSPTTPSYDPGVENSRHYDPAKASRLLDEAGWTARDAQGFRTKDGQRLSLFWPALPAASIREQRALLDQAVQADLARIGIDAPHPNVTAAEYNQRVASGGFALFTVSWARAEPDLLRLFFASGSKPPAGDNVAHLADAQVDQWTAAGASTTDQASRDGVYSQVQRRVLELGAMVPLYVTAIIDGFAKNVHGVAFDPNAWLLFYDAWKA
ncbi:ABC transporter substrate-binding protein [Amycolatopsis sp.]|uniref:ABC transporter substrate-binding protein n=1 Tax=Amycolatopsis sp. TaxID=37632 RepID=UPI002B888DA3|nr:ABC transporter substrate-binding protein [Amycolatopsis sp.]HVV11353.1 ABC transporter substrate-binding protein [Amycolatopsis sp.]